MKSQKGQAALVIVLVVVVALTIAVSIASQSVTTVSISTQQEEQGRAFSAAEAGVEDALRKGLSTLVGVPALTLSVGSSTVGYQVTKLSQFTADVEPGEVMTIDWANSDAAAIRADVTWCETGCSCSPALVYTIVTTTGNVVTHGVDANSPGNISRGINDRIVRIKFVGCTTNMMITGKTASGGNALLAFYQVDATGATGDSKSRVQVARPESAAVGILNYAVFSGGDIQ